MISRSEVQQKIDAAVEGHGEKFSLPERLVYLRVLLEVLDVSEIIKTDTLRRARMINGGLG